MNPPIILLVEDDDNDVFFLKLAFESANVESNLHVATDGQEALSYLAGEGEFEDRERHPFPDLILLDLKLPVKSGFEVLKWIRANPVCRKLVVIMLTASSQPADIDLAYELGANSFLVKPADLHKREHLIRRLKEYWLEANSPPSAGGAAHE